MIDLYDLPWEIPILSIILFIYLFSTSEGLNSGHNVKKDVPNHQGNPLHQVNKKVNFN